MARITHDRLLELLHYDPDTGKFTSKVVRGRGSNQVQVGQELGSLRPDGYFALRVDGRRFLAHTLAYFYMTGKWVRVDHENTNRSDTRWLNLRPSTQTQNMQNRSIGSNNTSGHKGVLWNRQCNKWMVRITVDKVVHYFGLYADFELACLVADEARLKCHGAFANNGGLNVGKN